MWRPLSGPRPGSRPPRAASAPDARLYARIDPVTGAARWLTRGALRDRARGIAAFLQDRVAPGGPVALVYPNSLDCLAALWGCILASRPA